MSTPEDGSGAVQLVSFYLEGRLYGLDIRVVKEINPNVDIARVPRTPDHIRGVVNVRGQVVLVIDISVVLGRAPRPVEAESHIVILKTASELGRVESLRSWDGLERFGDKPIAFLVDRIGDVVAFRADEVEPAPPHLTEASSRYVEGVVRHDGEAQVLLSAEELL